MFDTVFGLPMHPLVVHAVVVLLPLAAIGGVLVAVVPRVRERLGLLVALIAVAAVPAVIIATLSGQRLETRVNATFGPGAASAREAELMQAHTAIAGNLLPWAALLAIALVALMAVALRARRPNNSAWLRSGGHLASALVVLAAAANLYWVIRIGHAGSRAAWGDVIDAVGS